MLFDTKEKAGIFSRFLYLKLLNINFRYHESNRIYQRATLAS